MRKAILLVSAFAMVATSQAAERLLTGAEITEALSDHIYRHADVTKKVEQIFHANGATYYIEDGAQSQGLWEVRGNKYCSQWPPGEAWSCYTVSVESTVLTFISASGSRYPAERLDP
jgi:hypothetical protein